ncbi:hypothetical protein BN1058_02476 [Paraliobacillus sp. PM-2]|uniref:DUF4247 domain-containing protein n=1 Tax=Paraliobacillus sp. PM-2 TaxID=1462524 RepID=UPI00061C98AD|nr:DUF4247 domain-containing protein [Paraliobacillus sp. PM-2]CQR48128.1 hypothetical protein BN1058_02476 [Paraliobacillus sp. PM-2]
MKRWLLLLCLTLLPLLVACGEAEPASVDEIPDEASQAQLTERLNKGVPMDIESLLADVFYKLDTVVSDSAEANIYATRQFTLDELVDEVASAMPPKEISEKYNNQQMLIYPNHFVTFKQSEEEDQVILMEVAPDRFVRNNYSPNYLNHFFAFAMLNRMLSADNWAENKRNTCSAGSCYGGYTTGTKSFGGDVVTNRTNRGMFSTRGGGPSAGK